MSAATPLGMRIAHATTGPMLVAWLRVTITGAGHVPGAGGVLLAANHRSFLDHFLLSAACPRPLRFLGKHQLAHGPVGRFNVAMGLIPVERGMADLDALDVVMQALRAGAAVGIFPEGTRSPTGELFRFRSGAVRIAARAAVPIVPVGLLGTHDVWPRVQRWPSAPRPPRGRVAVHFGRLIPPPDEGGRSRREATQLLHERVAALCGQPVADGFAPIPI